MVVDMAQAGLPQMPKEAAAMLQGVKASLKGIVCLAKTGRGAEEFLAFQKAKQAGLASSRTPGLPTSPANPILSFLTGAEGIPYLIEVETGIDGTGPLIDMMKQIATMKMTSRVTDVSLAPIADEAFVVPADYTVTQQ